MLPYSMSFRLNHVKCIICQSKYYLIRVIYVQYNIYIEPKVMSQQLDHFIGFPSHSYQNLVHIVHCLQKGKGKKPEDVAKFTTVFINIHEFTAFLQDAL